VKGDNRGFALVITLIVTALLVALVTEFITEVYVDTTARQSYVDAQKAGLLAESGVAGAIGLLRLTLQAKDYTSLLDAWAKPLDIPEESGSLRVTIDDENAKLSLNHIAGTNGKFNDEADPTGSYYGTALRLFRKLQLPAGELCDAIADWVDDNDTSHPGGGETQFYSSQKTPILIKNAKIDTFEELAMVRGYSKIMEKIRPFTTVYAENSVAAPININTAPKEILIALDERISDALADQIIAYRKSTPFKYGSDLVKAPGMDRIATGLQSRITAKSSIFRIHAAAQVNGTTRVVESVVSFASGAPLTLYWREY
jgi:general secretion pathway protein K